MIEDPKIEICLNGQIQRVPSQQSVAALLTLLAIPSDRVAVEMNRSLIRKRDWTNTIVDNAAQIEIVEFVGGG